MAIEFAFPYAITASGRTKLATHAEHIRQLMELVLFTAPGDRVNRPTFGGGLNQFVFDPASTALAGSVEAVVQSALMQWMAELVRVEGVTVIVGPDGNSLEIVVLYTELATNQTNTATFTQSLMAST
jgi:uncharacterized protein